MYLNNKKVKLQNTGVQFPSDLLSLAGWLGAGQVGEHVLDLGHVGHNVLHKHQGRGVVHLALALLPQDVLVPTENIKS